MQDTSPALVMSVQQWSNYTDAEWLRILETVQSAKLSRLTDGDRKALTWFAEMYHTLTRLDVKPSQVAANRWGTVAKAAEKLKRSIETARQHDDYGVSFFSSAWIPYQDPALECDSEVTASSFEEMLSECKRSAEWIAKWTKLSIKREGKQYLRHQFFQEALRIWFEHGGTIKYNTGEEQIEGTVVRRGPLIAYFVAVTDPVMGSEAPAVETIRSFLRRMKKSGKINIQTIGPTWLSHLRDEVPR